MLLFLLGFVFQLNETSKNEYFQHLGSIHTLIWLYRQDIPQFEYLSKEWGNFEEEYRTNKGVLTSKVNCEEMADFCQSISQGKTLPLVLHGHHGKHFPTRYTGEYGPLSRFMSRWAYANPPECRIFNPEEPKYPAFVFYSSDVDSACRKAVDHEQFSAFTSGYIFAGNTTSSPMLVAHMRPNYTYTFHGNASRMTYNSFIRGLLPVSLGKWPLATGAQARRRAGFVVCRKESEIDAIKDLLLAKERDITFTIVTAEQFKETYPYIRLNSWDYPAVGVTNKRGKFLLVRGASPTNDHFKWVFNEAVAGKMDKKMYEKLATHAKKYSGFIRPFPENRKLYALLVVATISSAAGLLLVKVRRCVNNVGGKKPVAFEL